MPASVPKKVKRHYTLKSLSYRLDEGKRFVEFLQTKGEDPRKKWRKMMVKDYLCQTEAASKEFNRRCRAEGQTRAMNGLRLFYRRCVATFFNAKETAGLPDSDKHCRRGGGSFKQRFRQRTRLTIHQGARKKAPEVRESLFEWWSSLRFSIDVKVMTRIPPKLIMCKASQLLRDRNILCLKKGEQCNSPELDSHWLTGWCDEYNVSFRKPNKVYKVPERVLEQRLLIWWCNLFRVRRAAVLCLGYDLEMDNCDQSPFHKNEAGSKNVCTLSVRGAPEVPLIENHAATRARWSANTSTQSDFQIPDMGREPDPPPMECMFKADGHVLEARLHNYVRGYGFPWVSVATSPKATYREEHIIAFIKRHYQPASADARWRLFGLDMYGPQTTANVFNCCWHQKKILVNHPGGGTGVTQTNDTDLHEFTKADYIHEESELMMHLVRSTGKRCPTYDHKECVDIFTKIWSNLKLHVGAAKGYKKTGTTNALDGSEDHLICREAAKYWRKLDMPAKREQVLHDVDVEFNEGRLSWCYADIKRLIVPYPKTGHMDTIKEFQDDEFPGLKVGESAADSGGDESLDEENNHVVTANDSASSEESDAEDEVVDESSLGQGTLSTSHGQAVELTYEQAKVADAWEDKLAVYERARELMESVGDRSSAMAMTRTMHSEARKARGRLQQDLSVARALNDRVQEEFRADAERRIHYAKKRQAQADTKRLEEQERQLKRKTNNLKAQIDQRIGILESSDAVKSFAPEDLGQGLKNGGPKKCQDRRHEVLDRLAARGDGLTPQQKNDWKWFQKNWDAHMAAEYQDNWGNQFAGIAQNLSEQLESGNSSAVAEFMYNETRRVLGDIPVLRV